MASSSRNPETGSRRGTKKRRAGDGGRQVAEWVTLVVSLLLILGLAGYLVYRTTLPVDPYATIAARPIHSELRREGEHFILPVEVANRGRRPVREVQIEVRLRPPGGTAETREWTVDYLDGRSRQRTYLYLTWRPGPEDVAAAPILYRLE
jgi:uncharacterized protein (TIGR02588 family)